MQPISTCQVPSCASQFNYPLLSISFSLSLSLSLRRGTRQLHFIGLPVCGAPLTECARANPPGDEMEARRQILPRPLDCDLRPYSFPERRPARSVGRSPARLVFLRHSTSRRLSHLRQRRSLTVSLCSSDWMSCIVCCTIALLGPSRPCRRIQSGQGGPRARFGLFFHFLSASWHSPSSHVPPPPQQPPPAEGGKKPIHYATCARAGRSSPWSPCVRGQFVIVGPPDRGGGDPPDDHSWSKFQCSVQLPLLPLPLSVLSLFAQPPHWCSGWALRRRRRRLARPAVTLSGIEKGRPPMKSSSSLPFAISFSRPFRAVIAASPIY